MENDVTDHQTTINPKQQPLTTISKTQTDNPKRYENTYSSIGNEFGNMTTVRSLYSSNIDPQYDNMYVSCDPSINNYTKNAKYIKNKQMIMIPKCICEMYRYNYYQMMNQFNIQQFLPIKHKKSTLYKTTIFRNHHLVKDKPKKETTDKVNVSQPKPKKKKYKNYFYEELANQRNLKKMQRKLNKPSESLYKDLTEKCNETYKNYFTNESSNTNNNNKTSSQCNKDQITKTYESSWLINRKVKDEIPLVFPVILRDNNLFSSKSEETRHDKVNDDLLKIKYLISLEHDPKQIREIVIEYLKERNISAEYITEQSIQNFLSFINSDFHVDIHKSLKDNIITGITSAEHTNNNNNNKTNNTFVTQRKVKLLPTKKHLIAKQNTLNEKETTIKINREPLDTCLEAQTNLTWNKPVKTDNMIINELNNELEQIKEESKLNKQLACRSRRYKYQQHKQFNTEDCSVFEKPVADLRLGFDNGDDDCYEDNYVETEPSKPKSNLNSIVQRLYYSNIEKNPNFYLNIYKKKRKLLEHIMLERTKNKIHYDTFTSQYKHII